jgi:hypothetical protein
MKKYKIIDLYVDYDGAYHISYTLKDDENNIKIWTSSSPTWYEPDSILEEYRIGDIIYKNFEENIK